MYDTRAEYLYGCNAALLTNDSLLPDTQVLTLIVIIAGSACQSALSSLGDLNGSSLDESTRSACGWLIFVGVIALIYEALFIVLRFLNIGILNNHILWVLLIVSC